MSSELERAAIRFRGELDRREAGAFGELAGRYSAAFQRLQGDLEALHEHVEAQRAAGARVSPSWLHRQSRYLELQASLGRELTGLAQHVGSIIDAQTFAAITLADEHAKGLVETSLGPTPPGVTPVQASWARLNPHAVKAALAYQAPGSPLHALLAGLAPDGARAVGEVITTGIAAGYNPRKMARQVSRAFGVQTTRALTITRTETLRAYREASRQSYEANPRLVTGWRWVSALDRRTCAACWAMHGSEHKVDEQLDGHPNCRCVMAPLTPSWADIGRGAGVDLGDLPNRKLGDPGPVIFDRLDTATKLHVLGPGKLKLLEQGELELGDVVTRSSSRAWGTMRREASIKEALENAARRKAGGRAAAAGLDIAAATEEQLKARLGELEGRWEQLIDKVAPMFEPPDPRREQLRRNQVNGKLKLVRAGKTRSGRARGSVSPIRGARLAPTVKAETRALAEREILRRLDDQPEHPLSRRVEAELAEARQIRERLLELAESRVGFLAHGPSLAEEAAGATIKSVEPAAVRWRPTMGRGDAERWSSSSAAPGPHYHVTSTDAAAGIRAEGFEVPRVVTFGRAFGNGVYLTDDAGVADYYAGELKWATPERLEVRVNVAKVLEVDVSGIDAATLPFGTGVTEAAWERIVAAVPGGAKRLDELAAELERTMFAAGEQDGRYSVATKARRQALTELLREHGYDALRIVERGGVSDHIGGTQLVVLDPKAVTVVN